MTDARLAPLLLAADRAGLGGILLKARAGPARDRWLADLAAAFPPGTPIRRMPVGIADDRLLGGLDLSATLATGRPQTSAGLLAEVDGGVLLVPMAERLPPETAARLALALDRGEVAAPDGRPRPARLVLVLLDEGVDDEEVPPLLAERLALHLVLDDMVEPGGEEAARPEGSAPAEQPAEALASAAQSLGVAGVRPLLFAWKAALASAALAGRPAPSAHDLAVAARLVLAPRATRLPPPAEAGEEAPPPPPPQGEQPAEGALQTLDELTELAVAAARALLPPGLLEERAARHERAQAKGSGAGARRESPGHGRRSGVRQGPLRPGARLDLVETLKAAAPWQPLRRREQVREGRAAREGLLVRGSDFRIRRHVRPAQSTTIFLVDASGSAAVARLGEAKGAVELLLADSYVRRDEVALIAFRGQGAELLLPPTRSLARARRALTDLPGGGGTPLAAGLEAAATLAAATLSRGRSVTLVVLTDGRANVARAEATDPMADAEAAARVFRGIRARTLFIDTSARPRAEASRIATAMGAQLLPLPRAEPGALAEAVRAA